MITELLKAMSKDMDFIHILYFLSILASTVSFILGMAVYPILIDMEGVILINDLYIGTLFFALNLTIVQMLGAVVAHVTMKITAREVFREEGLEDPQ